MQDRVKMNQLQNLLHDALIATEHVENSAIIRRRDVSLRASSAGFTVGSRLLTDLSVYRTVGSMHDWWRDSTKAAWGL